MRCCTCVCIRGAVGIGIRFSMFCPGRACCMRAIRARCRAIACWCALLPFAALTVLPWLVCLRAGEFSLCWATLPSPVAQAPRAICWPCTCCCRAEWPHTASCVTGVGGRGGAFRQDDACGRLACGRPVCAVSAAPAVPALRRCRPARAGRCGRQARRCAGATTGRRDSSAPVPSCPIDGPCRG